jgi:DNA-directed RNA polymerase subunit RPC12/RpoP
MQVAREICRELFGVERELVLFLRHPDIDEYINAALSGDDGYDCTKCKGTQCTVQLIQTRSADEGMTAYIVCPSCKHRRPYI